MKSTLILLALALLVPAIITLVVLASQTPSVPLDVLNDCTTQIVGNCIVK